jgi:hypothetical protein
MNVESFLMQELEPQHFEEVRRVAREDGMTMQEIVRAAISDYVGRREFAIAAGDSDYAGVIERRGEQKS